MHLVELVLVSGATILGLMTLIWVVSVFARQASIVDVAWSLCFVAAAGAGLAFGSGAFPRRLMMFVLVSVWGLRLSSYILVRNWGKGEDHRYVAWREKHGTGYWWISLFQVFWLQGILALAVSLPIQVAGAGGTPSSLGPLDAIGAGLWFIGSAIEAVGDAQLSRFKADPANRGKVMDRGLWRYTRHPNYFGDAVVWWGLGLIGLSTPWGWLALVGPALMTFLLVRVSGVAMLERTITERRPGYADYVRRTSAFVPLPPKRIGPT